MHKAIYILVVAILVISSFLFGRASRGNESAAEYPLLAQRILIDNPNDAIVNFSSLRESISAYMTENSIGGSVYFEYLPTGTSIRITGDTELVAASLMKIPVVMDLYKAAELGRIDLDSTVELREEWLDSRYGQLYLRGAGYGISYREAAKLAMIDSDNTAYAAILFSTNKLLSVDENSISASDVSFSRDGTNEILISARSYTSFLKCLYFGCFVNFEHSQEILGYLSQSAYKDQLKAGIPESIKLAHKIGTFSDTTQSDCGIVYVEKRNYAICVMLKTDSLSANEYISDISKLAYDYIEGLK